MSKAAACQMDLFAEPAPAFVLQAEAKQSEAKGEIEAQAVSPGAPCWFNPAHTAKDLDEIVRILKKSSRKSEFLIRIYSEEADRRRGTPHTTEPAPHVSEGAPRISDSDRLDYAASRAMRDQAHGELVEIRSAGGDDLGLLLEVARWQRRMWEASRG